MIEAWFVTYDEDGIGYTDQSFSSRGSAQALVESTKRTPECVNVNIWHYTSDGTPEGTKMERWEEPKALYFFVMSHGAGPHIDTSPTFSTAKEMFDQGRRFQSGAILGYAERIGDTVRLLTDAEVEALREAAK